ncbi:MAG: putative secreted protein [Myxococcales bacterium]|nr:putative secreted protein [Myxococcales bacterium]
MRYLHVCVAVGVAGCGGHSSPAAPDAHGVEIDAALDAMPDAAIGPQIIATDQADPHWIAVDDYNIYWTNETSQHGQVMQLSKVGGTPVALASDLPDPEELAVDGTGVYFESLGASGVQGSVMSEIGGVVTTLAPSLTFPRHLALDAVSVYWTTDNGLVQKVARGGGAVQTLATNEDYTSLVTDGTKLFYIAYVGGASSTTLYGLPVNGGTQVPLASGVHLNGLAIAGSTLFWKDCSSLPPPRTCQIFAMPTSGGTPAVISTEPGNGDYQSVLAVDAQNVYWTDWQLGTVWRAPIAGGDPVAIGTNQRLPDGIAVDASAIYWTSYDGTYGNIIRCAK